MTAIRRAAALVLGLALAAGLTACSAHGGHARHPSGRYPADTDGPVTAAGDRTALAWMRSHPVPHRRGMVAGIFVSNSGYGDDSWFAFSVTVLTARGHTVTVWCGDPGARRSCPLHKGEVDLASDSDITNGQYVYVRADGNGNLPSGYRLIRALAVRLPQVCSPAYLSSGVFPYDSRYEKCVKRGIVPAPPWKATVTRH